jgi:hypothetical protein
MKLLWKAYFSGFMILIFRVIDLSMLIIHSCTGFHSICHFKETRRFANEFFRNNLWKYRKES